MLPCHSVKGFFCFLDRILGAHYSIVQPCFTHIQQREDLNQQSLDGVRGNPTRGRQTFHADRASDSDVTSAIGKPRSDHSHKRRVERVVLVEDNVELEDGF